MMDWPEKLGEGEVPGHSLVQMGRGREERDNWRCDMKRVWRTDNKTEDTGFHESLVACVRLFEKM